MRALLLCALSIVLGGCGSAAVDPTGSGGSCATASTTSTTSTAGSGGAGGAAPAPVAAVCDELISGPGWCPVNNYYDPLVSWVRSSPLVFRGTVTALHAITPGLLFDDPSRAVIAHVDKVIHLNGMLELEGQDVTVQLIAAPTMAVGYTGYFFAYGQQYGQTVLVGEVAHVDPGVYPDIESDVPGIEALLGEQRLYKRVMTSGAVVSGTVTGIQTLPTSGAMSEHDPLWAVATIAVGCALRGPLSPTVRVVFPTSNDIAWTNRPKLSVGQEGVFLLQPAPLPPKSYGIPADVPYHVDDAGDVLPVEERGHLATLVRCGVDG